MLKSHKVGAETELRTDASKFRYRSVLMQCDNDDKAFHPVFYTSRKTICTEEKYSSYELEVSAIVKLLKKFRIYLLGIHVKIVTDCRAFAVTMKKADLSLRVARWALLLEESDYIIEHRPGNSMKHVDTLSRYPLLTWLIVDETEESMTLILKL